MNARVRSSMRMLSQQMQRFGPYLLLELLLPGGTLFALLLFVYRNRPLKLRSRELLRRPTAVTQTVEPRCAVTACTSAECAGAHDARALCLN